MAKYRRNDPCPCGSGKKHKFCCLGKTDLFTEENSANLLTNRFIEDEEFDETWDSPGQFSPFLEEDDDFDEKWDLPGQFPLSLEEEDVDELMPGYNPMEEPDKDDWLSLDEMERIIMVSDYHKGNKITLPNTRLHATCHVIVENQLAENVPEVVAALKRLMSEGLDRHEAIHAVGSVLAGHIFKLLKEKPNLENANKPYLQELNSLTVEKWYHDNEN
jgi:hypothetical protein